MSYHVCAACGKRGDVTFSSTGERHAFLATCGKDDCPQTLSVKRFAALFQNEPKIQPNFAVVGTAVKT